MTYREEDYDDFHMEDAFSLIEEGATKEKIQQVLKKYPSLINEEYYGMTLLHIAARSRRTDLFGFLIDQGANINSVNLMDFTPLMYAAQNNDPEAVRYLLSRGAKNPFFEQPWASVVHSLYNPIKQLFHNETVGQQFDPTSALEKIGTKTFEALQSTIPILYDYNPHRHVKIWLSSEPGIFMGMNNQLRLIHMRENCPGDEINLVYDSKLLSPKAIDDMKYFCKKWNINDLDWRTLIPQCNNALENNLLEIYEDEITHLKQGGNLAAASDILRWLSPIYTLGTYSDLDQLVRTKGVPDRVPVLKGLLFSYGEYLNQGKKRSTFCNDLIAVIDLLSGDIALAQSHILKSCSPSDQLSKLSALLHFVNPEYEAQPDELRQLFSSLGKTSQFEDLYLNKTSREWRSNLPAFVYGLSEVNDMVALNGALASSLSPSTLQLLNLSKNNPENLIQSLYLKEVVTSTGPDSLKHFLKDDTSKQEAPFCSFRYYQSLAQMFPLGPNVGIYSTAQHNDLSWMAQYDKKLQKLDENALIIQRSVYGYFKKTNQALKNNNQEEDKLNNSSGFAAP